MLHCYGDSRFVKQDQNKEEGLFQKLGCTDGYIENGLQTQGLIPHLPGKTGSHKSLTAVLSIGGNDLMTCDTLNCVDSAIHQFEKVVSTLGNSYGKVLVVGPPPDNGLVSLPLSTESIYNMVNNKIDSYSNVLLLPLHNMTELAWLNDNIHFDDKSNTLLSRYIKDSIS